MEKKSTDSLWEENTAEEDANKICARIKGREIHTFLYSRRHEKDVKQLPFTKYIVPNLSH